ncbi:hypothetical protein [Bradyrhizobium icense]|uniref:hypothetical protein n=1 Tax=Bradyrhizobium icense TaxID=1274631 RepID=UPI0012EA4B70|nr:hypothetical protein [Bradyrhizobium icense]
MMPIIVATAVRSSHVANFCGPHSFDANRKLSQSVDVPRSDLGKRRHFARTIASATPVTFLGACGGQATQPIHVFTEIERAWVPVIAAVSQPVFATAVLLVWLLRISKTA